MRGCVGALVVNRAGHNAWLHTLTVLSQGQRRKGGLIEANIVGEGRDDASGEEDNLF